MFKNLSAFAYNPSFRPSLAEALEAVDKQSFLPCGPTQRVSVGFTPPRHVANSPLIESHQKHWFLEVTIEKRDLPGAVVNRKLEERLQDILDKTGRKPTGKFKKSLKEELVLELLPKAFTKIETLTLWLDPTRHLLSIDNCSKGKVELVTTLLASTFPGFYLKPLNTAQSVSACTAAWLLDGEPPSDFTIDDECSLVDNSGHAKSVIKYTNHNLFIDQIQDHLREGKYPVNVALTWRSRISFIVTDTLQLKKLSFLDVVFADSGYGEGEAFDVSAAIITGELSPLLADLVEAFGGLEMDDPHAAKATPNPESEELAEVF